MNLKQLIKECVHETINEQIERQAIREIVKNELRKMYNEGVFEGEKPENKKNSDEKSKNSAEADTARGQLNNILDNNPLIKKSQIAYHLMPDVDPDSARHILDDKLKGKDPLSAREANSAIDFIHNSGI